MSQVLVTDSYLSAIASAIRGKNGLSTTYKPSEMASAIAAIIGADVTLISQTFSSNGTYSASSFSADAFSSVVVDVQAAELPSASGVSF